MIGIGRDRLRITGDRIWSENFAEAPGASLCWLVSDTRGRAPCRWRGRRYPFARLSEHYSETVGRYQGWTRSPSPLRSHLTSSLRCGALKSNKHVLGREAGWQSISAQALPTHRRSRSAQSGFNGLTTHSFITWCPLEKILRVGSRRAAAWRHLLLRLGFAVKPGIVSARCERLSGTWLFTIWRSWTSCSRLKPVCGCRATGNQSPFGPTGKHRLPHALLSLITKSRIST